MAKNTGEDHRHGQVTGRYPAACNERTDRYDKFDGDGNYISSKSTPNPYKGVEKSEPKKPPRG